MRMIFPHEGENHLDVDVAISWRGVLLACRREFCAARVGQLDAGNVSLKIAVVQTGRE